jgi:hypothetical protein
VSGIERDRGRGTGCLFVEVSTGFSLYAQSLQSSSCSCPLTFSLTPCATVHSESSLFIAPHLVILKTCGTTINLLGLTRIIEIAREYCGFEHVHRCFYSRKSFFFPERQVGPHVGWKEEVDFLDGVFSESRI